MSWTLNRTTDTCIGLTVARNAEIEFLVSEHHPNSITLMIGDSVAEISFDPSTVERLRDKVDAALRKFREAVAKRKADAADKHAAPVLVGAAEVVS